MNWRYGIHPNNYAIGETEKYYSDMSEKGWELVKCGITLSRFQKTEPKKMRYRVEVVNLKSLEDGHLPEEQIAVGSMSSAADTCTFSVHRKEMMPQSSIWNPNSRQQP